MERKPGDDHNSYLDEKMQRNTNNSSQEKFNGDATERLEPFPALEEFFADARGPEKLTCPHCSVSMVTNIVQRGGAADQEVRSCSPRNAGQFETLDIYHYCSSCAALLGISYGVPVCTICNIQ